MNNEKSCNTKECCTHLAGVHCDVKNCVYHDGENYCKASSISVGPSYATTSRETACATFEECKDCK